MIWWCTRVERGVVVKIADFDGWECEVLQSCAIGSDAGNFSTRICILPGGMQGLEAPAAKVSGLPC